jgi:mannose-6-phosphate isomerase-like protein (cupin superfamily)
LTGFRVSERVRRDVDPIRAEERIRAMTTLQVTRLGVVVEIRKTGEDTGGELVEFDVIGRARGIIAQPHVHTQQSETHEVIEGSMRLIIDGEEHVLRPGDRMTVPVGVPHRQLPGPEPGPAACASSCAPRATARRSSTGWRRWTSTASASPGRWPAPSWCATSARPATPPSRRCASSASSPRRSSRPRRASTCSSTSGTSTRRARPCSTRSPTSRSYPRWWKPVYVDVEADGEPALGKESRQHFKGRLPYHLHTRSRIVELDAPSVVRGRSTATCAGSGGGR